MSDRRRRIATLMVGVAALWFGCSTPEEQREKAGRSKRDAREEIDAKKLAAEAEASAVVARLAEIAKLRREMVKENDPKRRAELDDQIQSMKKDMHERWPYVPSTDPPRPVCTCASTDPLCDCL